MDEQRRADAVVKSWARSIEAVMQDDWVDPYRKLGCKIPIVTRSSHPRYTVGTRLDWGYVATALDEGYEVTINPYVDR